MSGELAIIVWLALVVASAVVASYASRRWGRDPFGWILLCVAMGPIALVALFGTHQRDRARSTGLVQGDAGAHSGPIVVACDGSDVVDWLAALVRETHREGCEVMLLAVLPYDVEEHGDSAEVKVRADAMTAAARRALEQHGVPTRTIVRYGPPGEAIVRFANETSASLIVIGRRGAGLTRALLGSVSGYVTQHAGVPVAIVT